MNRRKRMMENLDQDIRDHIGVETQDNIDRGMTPAQARLAAMRKFGNVAKVKEETWEIWSLTWLEQFFRDVGYGARTLWKNPGFTIVALLALTLGIGANTAIFSVVEGVVLAPLPYPQADRLVMLHGSRPTLKHMGISYPDFRDWQSSARSFEQMAAVRWRSYDLAGGAGESEHLDGMEVSAGFLSTLGVKPARGRDFSPAEDQPHGAPAVIISDRLWKERFQSSPEAIGKSLILDGMDNTIVGILSPGFHFWTNADVYTSLGQGETLLYNDRSVQGLIGMGRLKSGVSVDLAEAEMGAIQENLDRLYSAQDRNLKADVVPMKQYLVGDAGGTLLLLLGAAGMVLLIACINVANLVLARAAARTREFAIRSALGANRSRIVRQLLTESVLLAFTGGILGLIVAKLGVSLVLAKFSADLPRTENIGVNLPVLFFAVGISIAVGILFGLAPALKSSRADVQGSLKAGARGSTHAHPRAQSALIIVQMALTLVMLVGAGLLLKTIRHLWSVNPGFSAQHVITFKVGLSPSLTKTPSDTRLAYRQLLERIEHIPGVEAADFTSVVPLSEQDNGGPFWIGPQQSTSMMDAPHALYFETGPDYLQAMKIPLLRGRFFTPADAYESEPVVVIDSVLAHTYFRDKDPVGQTITVAHWRTARIVGVVGHVRHWGLGDPGTYNPSQIYISFYQISDAWVPTFAKSLSVAVRTPLDAATIMREIKNVIYGVAKDQPVYDIQTIEQVVTASMAAERLPMMLLGAFSSLALVLASVGIYGVISYSVTQRVQEIGIRMALGAKRRDVLRMVLGQGLLLVVVGLMAGAGVALLLGRLLSSFSHLLYGVGANDPATLVTVSAILLAVAAAACSVPARRAMRVNPIVALRYE